MAASTSLFNNFFNHFLLAALKKVIPVAIPRTRDPSSHKRKRKGSSRDSKARKVARRLDQEALLGVNSDDEEASSLKDLTQDQGHAEEHGEEEEEEEAEEAEEEEEQEAELMAIFQSGQQQYRGSAFDLPKPAPSRSSSDAAPPSQRQSQSANVTSAPAKTSSSSKRSPPAGKANSRIPKKPKTSPSMSRSSSSGSQSQFDPDYAPGTHTTHSSTNA